MRYFILIVLVGVVFLLGYVPVNKKILDCKRDWSIYGKEGFEDKYLKRLLDKEPADLLDTYHGILKNDPKILDKVSDKAYFEMFEYTDFILHKNIFGKFISVNNNITDFEEYYVSEEDHRNLYFYEREIDFLNENRELNKEYKLDILIDKIDLTLNVKTYGTEFGLGGFETFYNCKLVDSKI
tara:strand:+ start:68 stop:613 length:546 start_codon:yes stop_codon:yes gene_type:complete